MNKIEKRKHNILNNPNLMKTMIIMSLPLFFSNLLKRFHDIVDSFLFLGYYFKRKVSFEKKVKNVVSKA